MLVADDRAHRLLTFFGCGYIALDTAWLLAIPKTVKSPTAVLSHHAATLLVLLDPLCKSLLRSVLLCVVC